MVPRSIALEIGIINRQHTQNICAFQADQRWAPHTGQDCHVEQLAHDTFDPDPFNRVAGFGVDDQQPDFRR